MIICNIYETSMCENPYHLLVRSKLVSNNALYWSPSILSPTLDVFKLTVFLVRIRTRFPLTEVAKILNALDCHDAIHIDKDGRVGRHTVTINHLASKLLFHNLFRIVNLLTTNGCGTRCNLQTPNRRCL